MRLITAAISCAAIPILAIFADLRWRKEIRPELPSWRNGAALASIFHRSCPLADSDSTVGFPVTESSLHRASWRGLDGDRDVPSRLLCISSFTTCVCFEGHTASADDSRMALSRIFLQGILVHISTRGWCQLPKIPLRPPTSGQNGKSAVFNTYDSRR
jgi:hypothetical protein